MAKAAAEVGRGALQPEQPVHRLDPCGGVFGQERVELFGQVEQDVAALKHAGAGCGIQQRRDLGVGVDAHKARAKLITLLNVDQPCVVFGTSVTCGQQLFQHDGDFDTIGRGQGVQLEWVLAHWQLFVMRWPGNGAVDRGELAAGFRVPGPDFRGRVVSHCCGSGLSYRVLLGVFAI